MEFVHRKNIDTGRWDELIENSTAETIYAYSWYLDAVAENWSALMVGDYQFVMPLIWKKKYGIRFLYQPFYTQQLGVFSREYVDPILITSMLSMLPGKFRFGNVHFNIQNLVGEEEPFTVDDKSNYVLDLNRPYDDLNRSFSTNAKRNVKRAWDIGQEVEKDLSLEDLVAFKRANDVIKRTEDDYTWLVHLLETICEKSAGAVYASRIEGGLSAAAFFGFSRRRAIYLVSVSNETGKENRSMFKLVDSFIRDHSGTELVLDFEGSNIPSVARFFGGFGARPEIYQGVSFNRMPMFLNKLRKHGG